MDRTGFSATLSDSSTDSNYSMDRTVAFSEPVGYLQQICELQIISLDAKSIVLVTPRGRQVVVRAPPGYPNRRDHQEFQWNYTVKDLGIQARLALGLEGYTPIWQTTRIRFQGAHLPMHRPVATLCPQAEWYYTANHYCTFCHFGLRNLRGRLGPFRECWFCQDSPTWHHGHCCPHNPAAREWNGVPHLLQIQRRASWDSDNWTVHNPRDEGNLQDPNLCQDSRDFRNWLRTLPF